MINFDEKEIKKEKKRQEKEERNHKKREKFKSESIKQKIEKHSGIKINKKILIIIPILILLLISFIFKDSFISFLNNAGRNDIYKNYLLLPNVTGYQEEDAIYKLKDAGFVNIKNIYIIDKFTEDKCVIKTNYHINSQLKSDEEILLYICDKSLLNEETDKENENIPSVNTSYFSLDNISVLDIAIENNYFYCIIKNNNKQAIKNIEYKIGYQDNDNLSIGEAKYQLEKDILVLPGEKITISGEIKNTYAKYIYISGFSYEKIDVPENERK